MAVSVLLGALGIYAAAGVLFAAAFVTVGIARVDPVAHHAPWSFRLLVAPGAAALWPLLLLRWARGVAEPPAERNAHRAQAARGGHP